jgi:hypothetical protein
MEECSLNPIATGRVQRGRRFEDEGRGFACPRCKTIMDEVVRIAPLESEPGLIGYECPACCYVTSVLLQSKGCQKRRS